MFERNIQLKPLTKEAFAEFGDVIEIEGAKHFSINSGAVERYHDLAKVETDEEGRVIISIVSCNEVSELPYQVKVIERHPLGSQAFIPLCPAKMIVVVVLPSDKPDFDGLQAFISNGEQGINFNRGVWHMPLISTQKDQRYLVVDRGGDGNNCDTMKIDEQKIIVCE